MYIQCIFIIVVYILLVLFNTLSQIVGPHNLLDAHAFGLRQHFTYKYGFFYLHEINFSITCLHGYVCDAVYAYIYVCAYKNNMKLIILIVILKTIIYCLNGTPSTLI